MRRKALIVVWALGLPLALWSAYDRDWFDVGFVAIVLGLLGAYLWVER